MSLSYLSTVDYAPENIPVFKSVIIMSNFHSAKKNHWESAIKQTPKASFPLTFS